MAEAIRVAAPISGWLLDRFGPRRVMLICLSVLAVGVSGTTFMKEYWQLVLLWGVVVGLAALIAFPWYAPLLFS